MKIALLDTVGGIAGDMTMAAFVAAGMPFAALQEKLAPNLYDLGGIQESNPR